MKSLLLQLKLLYQILTLTRQKFIYKIATDSLGMDVTPLDDVDDVLACAETVTTILKKAGAIDRIIAGTWTLERHLMQSKHWIPVLTPMAGDVVISATGTSKKGKNAPFRGHVAIYGMNGVLMSNDSYSGLWQANYTILSWRNRYGKRGGYPVQIYRYLA